MVTPKRGRLMSAEELEQTYGYSQFFWRRMARERRIPSVKAGRGVRFYEHDVDDFLAASYRDVV